MHKAKDLSGNCTAAEKALIYVMQVRYLPDTTQTREHLNQLYALYFESHPKYYISLFRNSRFSFHAQGCVRHCAKARFIYKFTCNTAYTVCFVFNSH